MNPYQSLRADLQSEDWREQALCAQVSIAEFHADKGDGAREQINFAKKVCGLCDVRPACLNFAIQMGERFGIWGGLAPRGRDRAARRLGITRTGFEDWHGCEAGARRHYRKGTAVCADCRRAERIARERRRVG